jgi:hypothetical protein
MADDWLIWSNDQGAWWRYARRGYTLDVSLAGVYSREDAYKICAEARDGWRALTPPPEIPVRLYDVRQIDKLCLARRLDIERKRK